MLPRLLTLTLATALLSIPCAASAEDGGESADEAGTSGDTGADASTKDAAAKRDGAAEDSGQTAAEGEGGPVAVVACDGALCDTQQGRPDCEMAGPIGHAALDSGVLLALSVPLALVIVRRSRRGASRPGAGGRAC